MGFWVGSASQWRRRSFLLGATVGLHASVDARAQTRRRRIGALLIVSPDRAIAASVWTAFRDTLRTFGWVDGQNLEIVVRATGGDQRKAPAFAEELLDAGVELVIASDTPSAQALFQRTKTVPIILVGTADPVAAGLVSSLARPGGNVTGIGNELNEIAGKAIEFSREVVPGLRRFAVAFNPKNPASARGFHMFEAAARRVGIEVIPGPVTVSEELEPALANIARERPQVMDVHPAQPMPLHSARIAEFAISHRIVTFAPTAGAVRDGHLLHFGPAAEELYGRAAYYVDRILRGAAPSDLPVELPRLRLTINLATARTLGVAIPASLLTRADEVIR